MSTKTVNLTTLPQTANTKILSKVRAGQMSLPQYHTELFQVHQIQGSWSPDDQTFTLNLEGGLKDPSGEWLTTEEYIEVLKSLLPSPLELAGKQLDLVGPLMGAGGMIVVRAWYVTKIRLGTISRTTGLISWQDITPIEAYRVKLKNPDANERITRREGNQVWLRTSQLRYKRFSNNPKFDYYGELSVRFQVSPWNPNKIEAQVADKHFNFAWLQSLAVIEDL